VIKPRRLTMLYWGFYSLSMKRCLLPGASIPWGSEAEIFIIAILRGEFYFMWNWETLSRWLKRVFRNFGRWKDFFGGKVTRKSVTGETFSWQSNKFFEIGGKCFIVSDGMDAPAHFPELIVLTLVPLSSRKILASWKQLQELNHNKIVTQKCAQELYDMIRVLFTSPELH